jgi:TRAP-type C4-dicarboxylate transport system permease small subunit
VHRLLRLCDITAVSAVAILFVVVAVNVMARSLFDITGQLVNLMIPGAIEISRYALMVAVMASLPRAAATGMVRVDLLVERLPPRLSALLDRIWFLAIAAFGAAASWLLLAEAVLQVTRGDASQDLEIPMWLLTGFAGLVLAALAVTGLWLALRGRPK